MWGEWEGFLLPDELGVLLELRGQLAGIRWVGGVSPGSQTGVLQEEEVRGGISHLIDDLSRLTL